MANQHTWRTAAKAINDDKEIMASLVESAQAPEKVARSPAEVFIRMHADIGDAGFEVLPEPGSNQEKKADGLGFHIGDNLRTEMDANPTRYWDKYFYKDEKAGGVTVNGSVYVDMVRDTTIGKSYYSSSEVLKAWNSQDAKPETLQKTVTIDGVVHECSMIDGKQRGDMAAMLDQRINNMASALRRVVGIWRQKKAIERLLSEHCEVTFVYNKRDMPESGLANVKKPILLLELNANKESPQYGQRTGFAETFAPSVFIKLDVEKAVGAKTGNKYQILKDSRRETAASKKDAGAGASTQEKGKAAIEGRVSSNNLLTVMGNLRVFAEDEDSKRHTFNRMVAMKADDRAELIASILQFREWSAVFDTPENRKIAAEYAGTAADRAREALTAKTKADAETAELAKEPSQHERNAAAVNAMRTTQGEDVAAAKARADAANTAKPAAGKGGASKGGTKAVSK